MKGNEKNEKSKKNKINKINKINKRIRKPLLILGLLLLSPMLGACSLAVEGAGAEGSGDRMIGAFITQEYLDLFDMDSWLDDHASKLENGKNLQISGTSGYEQKLYAEIDKNNSEDPEDWEITFPGAEGINFFAPIWTEEDGQTYRGGVYGDSICDADISIRESDTEKGISLSGTVYVLPGGMNDNKVYYANPVYQTESGEIYTVSSSGVSTSGEVSEGTKLTTTFNEKEERSENGNSFTETCSVNVDIAIMYQPVQITVCEMDHAHRILRQTVYAPGEMPEEFTTEPETEYIVLETVKEDQSGKRHIARELWEYEEGEETYMRSFAASESGVLVGYDTKIVWAK